MRRHHCQRGASLDRGGAAAGKRQLVKDMGIRHGESSVFDLRVLRWRWACVKKELLA
jgi:hypothetical protein